MNNMIKPKSSIDREREFNDTKFTKIREGRDKLKASITPLIKMCRSFKKVPGGWQCLECGVTRLTIYDEVDCNA